MSVLRITDVAIGEAPSLISGAGLHAPRAGDTSDVYSFDIHGWALGRTESVEAIAVHQEGRPVAEASPWPSPAELPEELGDADDEARVEFITSVGTLDLRTRFELTVRATLAGGAQVNIARINGERAELASGDTGPSPLLVNTIGRSGSTWLVWLLSCHPEIVALRPFNHDTRVATYWTSILQTLSRPSSYLRQVNPQDLARRDWWLEGPTDSHVADEAIGRWLGHESVESLASTCKDRIDQFYERVAASEGRTGMRYFVEKCLPYQVQPDLLDELYPSARELILVRDFRDQLCSIIAFDEKRGYRAFGREQRLDDAEYVRTTLRLSARRMLRRWEQRRDRAQVVRYEDLVLDPEATLSGVLDYLGLEAGDDLIEEIIARASRESGQAHRTTPSAAASIGRWRRDLPLELIEECHVSLGDALVGFGYETQASVESAPHGEAIDSRDS
jgi:hypothetical protein